MEHELPPWLNEQFLSSVLQNGHSNVPEVKIVEYSAKPAVATGDNYTSNMWRVHVEYKTGSSTEQQSESLIIKAHIQEGFYLEATEMLPDNILDKEARIYREILPKMYDKTKHNFGPTSFYCPISGMVLKDLKSEGYVMRDRIKQLDFSHCKMVIETLARYHGTSVACHHDNPQLIETIGKDSVYGESGGFSEISKLWIEAAVRYSAKLLNETDGQQSLADFISSRAHQVWDSVVKMCKPKLSGLNVLNHGDCWTNNIMFKHDESGKVVDVKLIDFQIPRYISPAGDLTYFLWTSANEEVRENKREELFKIYLQTLNTTFEELGSEERLSHEELQNDLKSGINWSIYVICFVLPFCSCEPENVLDIKNLNLEIFKVLESDERFQKMYSGKRFRAFLASSVRQLESWTLL